MLMEDHKAKEGRHKGSVIHMASPVTISPSPHPPTGSVFPSGQSSSQMGGLVVPPFILPVNSSAPLHHLLPSNAPSFLLPFSNHVEISSQYLQYCPSQLFVMNPTQSGTTLHQFEERKRKKCNNRPKVVPERGSFPCEAQIRKKPTQKCRNACLMEYLGATRPKYCAEHIDQDPESVYTKCHYSGSSQQPCKEIVLKEFVHCHKHFDVVAAAFSSREGYDQLLKYLDRACDIVTQLEKDIAVLKARDQLEIAQRKGKLLPKYVELRNKIMGRLNLLASLGLGPGGSADLEKEKTTITAPPLLPQSPY